MPYMLPLLNMQADPPQSSKQQHQQMMMRTVSISILVMSLPVLYVSFLHVPPAALFRDTTFWFLMSNSIIIVIAADSGMLFFRSSCSADAAADANDGLSFAVSGDETVAVKNVSGHASSPTGDSVSGEVVLPVEAVENQALVVREHGHLTVIAENDHAMVLRDGQAGGGGVAASQPESREIVVVSPSSALSAGAGAGEAVKNVDGAVARAGRPQSLTASRSLARGERMRRRRDSHHRPSSHSHALVPVQDKSVVVREERHLRRAATEGRPPAAAEESEYSRLSDEELNRRVEEFITKFNREIRLQVEREQLALAAA